MRFLIYIVALLILGGAAFFIYQHAPRIPSAEGAATSTSAGADVHIKEQASTYTIDIAYKHLGNATADAQIDANVKEAVDSFKKDAAQYPPDASRPYSLQGQSADVYVGGDILSERIDLYQDTGGAHGMPIVLTFNFDASGKVLTVDDTLKLIGKTLPEVSSTALAQLHQEFGSSVFEEGAAPAKDNYASFIVGPYNVTFIFQAYQVVAYAAGMPEVSFARQ